MNKILILEDDKNTILLYKKLLKDYDLSIAYSVSQAIEFLEYNTYDLFILDVYINKSKFTGLDFAKFIKGKILICTGFNIDYLREVGYKDYNYLQKPIEVKDFKNYIDNLINS